MFTAPGAQVYGTQVWGRHELSVTATHSFDHDVRRSDERLLIDLSGLALRPAHPRLLERAGHGL